MKTITISDQTFEYKVYSDCNEWGEWDFTEFYQGTEVERRKKYIFFGPIIETVVPKLIFDVGYNIEDTRFTKAVIKSRLEYQVELLSRKEEIKKGEII